MEAELRSVADALAELAETELRALVAAANDLLLMAPGLLAWIEHAADWEQHRRAGLDFPLQPPNATIDPSEDVASIAAAGMLREQFKEDVPSVAALFDALVGALTGTATRQS